MNALCLSYILWHLPILAPAYLLKVVEFPASSAVPINMLVMFLVHVCFCSIYNLYYFSLFPLLLYVFYCSFAVVFSQIECLIYFVPSVSASWALCILTPLATCLFLLTGDSKCFWLVASSLIISVIK